MLPPGITRFALPELLTRAHRGTAVSTKMSVSGEQRRIRTHQLGNGLEAEAIVSEEVEDSTYDLKVFGLVQRDSFIGYRLRGFKNSSVSIRIPLHIWRDVFPVVRLGGFHPCPL